MNEKFVNAYKNDVLEFFKNCSKEKIDEKVSEEYPSLFIPGIGKNYSKITPKIMYVGIDNNGWRDLGKQIREYNMIKNDETKLNDFASDIINFSSQKLDEQLPFVEWKFSFWEFIERMQTAVLNKYGKGKEINEEVIRTSFVWSNTNSIELFDHIKNEDSDEEVHKKIKEFSKPFDSLYKTISALTDKPDLVIILSWNEDESDYTCMEINKKKDYEHHLQYFEVSKDNITIPIIWTAHPRYLSTKEGLQHYIDASLNIIEKEKIF